MSEQPTHQDPAEPYQDDVEVETADQPEAPAVEVSPAEPELTHGGEMVATTGLIEES